MIGALEREIERINDLAREVGRDDLVRSPSATRADVLRELGGLAPDDVAAETVVRNGASDEEHHGRVRAKLE